MRSGRRRHRLDPDEHETDRHQTHARSGVITALETAGMDGVDDPVESEPKLISERQVRIQAIIVCSAAARLRPLASSLVRLAI